MHNWYKHGMFGTPEYKAWAAMIQRCSNPKDNRYYTHGERISKNNTSGAKGVYRKGDKWEVWIFKDLKRIYIGKYTDLEIAIESRKQAEIKYWKNG